MKQTFTRIVTLLSLTLLLRQAKAQTTYTISANTNWSALSPSPNWCTGCTFNIATGATLTLNTSTGCTNCTFNGGALTDNATFSFNGGAINTDTAAIVHASNFYTGSSGGVTFSNGAVLFSVAVTCQACTFSNETVHVTIPSGSTMTLQSSGGYTTATFNNSNLTMSSGSTLYANAKISMTNSSLTLNSDVLKSDVGAFSLSGSQLYLNGNSSLAPTAGPLTLSNTSAILVGDGSLASTAYLDLRNLASNQLHIDATSLVKITNGNNYYYSSQTYQYTNSSGASSSIATATNTISCNYSNGSGSASGHAHSCAVNYVYGCATLSSTALGCITLATANIDLTASAAGPGQATLSFTDQESTPADRYLIQRSTSTQPNTGTQQSGSTQGNNNTQGSNSTQQNTGDAEWQTIATLNAGGYTPGQYRYTDAGAPAGSIQYRIQRIGINNEITYSPIASISIDPSVDGISIHPNPVTGGTFFLTTPYAGSMIVNIYTLTGQLLQRSELAGSTQYAIRLPQTSLPAGAVVVQTICPAGVRSFTVLVR
jgi:hypothetical protein